MLRQERAAFCDHSVTVNDAAISDVIEATQESLGYGVGNARKQGTPTLVQDFEPGLVDIGIMHESPRRCN